MAAAASAAEAPVKAVAEEPSASASDGKSVMLTTDAPQVIEHIHQSLTVTPTDTRWVPSSAKFVLIGERPRGTGSIQVYELDGGSGKLVHEVRAGSARGSCLKLAKPLCCAVRKTARFQELHVWSNDAGGPAPRHGRLRGGDCDLVRLVLASVRVSATVGGCRDLERTDAPLWSARGHSAIVNCLDGCGGLGIGGGAPELVSCSRDGEELVKGSKREKVVKVVRRVCSCVGPPCSGRRPDDGARRG
jgi:WD repeat-containing protein 92